MRRRGGISAMSKLSFSVLGTASAIVFSLLTVGCGLSTSLLNLSSEDPTRLISMPPMINAPTAPSVPISGVCPAGVTEISVVVDGTELARLPCSQPSGRYEGRIDVSILPDGPIKIEIHDPKTGREITSIEVILDTVNPTGSVTAPPFVNQDNVSSFPVSGTCSDSGTKVIITVLTVSRTVTCTNNTFSAVLDLSSLPQGPTNIQVSVHDQAGNLYSMLRPVVIDTQQVITFTLVGVPADPSPVIQLNVSVVGTDVHRYRYKLGPAASTNCALIADYSAPIPVATVIDPNIAAMADGNLRICALALDEAGNQTPLTAAVSATWRKDVTIALALIGPYVPAGLISNSTVNRTVAITGVQLTDYKAVVVKDTTCAGAATDWSALSFVTLATPLNFPISGDGVYRVCALGRNVAGFTQLASAPSESSALIIDTVSPTFSLTGSLPAQSNVATWTVRMTANEDITGFEASDVNVTNGSLGSITAINAREYDLTFSATANGMVTISVLNTGWTDLATNIPSSAVQNLSFIYDNQSPTVTLSSTRGDPSMATPFVLNVDFNEDITGLDATDFTVVGASLSGLAGGPRNFTLSVTPNTSPAPPSLSVSLPANRVLDLGNNNNVASATFTRTLDSTPPDMTLSSLAAPVINSAWLINVSASENITNLTMSDFLVTNGVATSLNSVSGSDFELTVVPLIDGAVTVNLPNGVLNDLVGNLNTDNESISRVYDSIRPTVVLTSAAPASINTTPFNVTITFSEPVTGFVVGDIATTNATLSGFAGSGSTYTVTVAPSAEGNVSLQVNANVAQDSGGNLNLASSSISRLYDTTPPAIAVSLPAANTQAQTGLTISGTCEAGLTITLSGAGIQSPASTTCAAGTFSQAIVFTAGEGSKVVNLSQTDAAGNTGSASRTFVRDNTAPVVAISAPAAATEAQTGVTLSGTCEAGVTVNLAGTGLLSPSSTTCAAGTFTQAILFTAGQGSKAISVSQTDPAGNLGTDSRSFVRDNTPPTLTITSPAVNSSAQTGVVLSGACESGLSVTLSGSGWTSPASTTCSGSAYSVAVVFTAGEGTKNIIVSQTDPAGNLATANRDFVRDNSGPSCSFTAGPNGWTNQTAPAFTFNCTDVNGVASSQCRLSTGSWGACSSATTYSLSGLVAGSYEVQVRATDNAGNVGTHAARTFSVDTSAPTTPSLTPSNTNTGSPSFTFASSDGESGVASFECSLDTGAASYSACTSGQVFSGQNTLVGTTYTFRVRALNNAGSNSVVSTTSWTNGNWSGWGSCSVTCGGGTQSRTCTSPSPSASPAGLACSGSSSQACNTSPCDCNLPWGGTLTNGNSVTAYSSSSALFPTTCASISQTRICSTGVLSGSFSNQTCAQNYTYDWQVSGWFGCSASWNTGGWSSCTNSSCSGGSQTRSVWCSGGSESRSVSCLRNDGATVADGFCNAGTRPSSSQACSCSGGAPSSSQACTAGTPCRMNLTEVTLNYDSPAQICINHGAIQIQSCPPLAGNPYSQTCTSSGNQCYVFWGASSTWNDSYDPKKCSSGQGYRVRNTYTCQFCPSGNWGSGTYTTSEQHLAGSTTIIGCLP